MRERNKTPLMAADAGVIQQWRTARRRRISCSTRIKNGPSKARTSCSTNSMTAALRGGMLRMARSRACLSTSCRVCFIPLTPAAFGCAPRGHASHGAQSRLPQHFVPGLFYSAHASSFRLRSAGACFAWRAVALASALRASDCGSSLRLNKVGERPAAGG